LIELYEALCGRRVRIWFEELDKDKEIWKKLWNEDLDIVKRNIFKKL